MIITTKPPLVKPAPHKTWEAGTGGKCSLRDGLLALSFLRDSDGDVARCSLALVISDRQGHRIGTGFVKFM